MQKFEVSNVGGTFLSENKHSCVFDLKYPTFATKRYFWKAPSQLKSYIIRALRNIKILA